MKLRRTSRSLVDTAGVRGSWAINAAEVTTLRCTRVKSPMYREEHRGDLGVFEGV